MKKIYLSPVTETVNVKLYGSVMDEGIDIINNSTDVSDEGLGKENNLLFEDDAFGDIWGEGDNSSNPYDLWGE